MSSGQLSASEPSDEIPLPQDGIQMMDNWHKMRKAIVPGHAEEDAEKLLHSYGLDYDPAEWPYIASQLVKGILGPTEFDVMPEDSGMSKFIYI